MIKSKQMAAMALVGMAVACGGAHAAVVQDGWTMSALGTTTTNIGHMALNGADRTMSIQVGTGGEPFVGARFQDFGQTFSINYVLENAPGLNDFGFPQNHAQPLDGFRFLFSGL